MSERVSQGQVTEQRWEIRYNFHTGGLLFYAGLCWDVCRNLGKVNRQVTAVADDTKLFMAVKVMLIKQVFKRQRRLCKGKQILVLHAKWEPNETLGIR